MSTALLHLKFHSEKSKANRPAFRRLDVFLSALAAPTPKYEHSAGSLSIRPEDGETQASTSLIRPSLYVALSWNLIQTNLIRILGPSSN